MQIGWIDFSKEDRDKVLQKQLSDGASKEMMKSGR